MFYKAVAFVVGVSLAVLAAASFGPESLTGRKPLVSVTFASGPTSECAKPAAKSDPCDKPFYATTDLVVGDQYVYGQNGKKIQRYGIVGYLGENTRDQLMIALESAGKAGVTDIELLIDSRGGRVDVGFGMAALLSDARPVVHCLVTRGAESAAFLLLQGCDDRAALPSSSLMEHYAFLYVPAGEEMSAESLSAHAGSLYASRQLMIAIFAARSLATLGEGNSITSDMIGQRLSQGDWVMTSAEAVAFGLLDRVVSDMKTFQYSVEKL